MSISENLINIQSKIQNAEKKSGRPQGSVQKNRHRRQRPQKVCAPGIGVPCQDADEECLQRGGRKLPAHGPHPAHQ